MLTALDSGGIRYFCYVMPDSMSIHQKNLNFAVSANLKGKNFSVDNRGVVEVLGTHEAGILSYNDAINTCASMGARMMGVEQLKALHASYGTDNVSGFTAYYHNTFTVVKGPDTFHNFYIHMENTGAYSGAISYNNFSAMFACGK